MPSSFRSRSRVWYRRRCARTRREMRPSRARSRAGRCSAWAPRSWEPNSRSASIVCCAFSAGTPGNPVWKPPITAWIRSTPVIACAWRMVLMTPACPHAVITTRPLARDVDDHGLVVDRRIVVDEAAVALEEDARGAAAPDRDRGLEGNGASDLPGRDRARCDAHGLARLHDHRTRGLEHVALQAAVDAHDDLAIAVDEVLREERVRVDGDGQRRAPGAQDAEQAAEVVGVPVADHRVLELLRRPPERAQVVCDHHLVSPAVEEHVVPPLARAQLDPVGDPVLRADRLAVRRCEVIEQPEALDPLARRERACRRGCRRGR